ncbi:MAG: DUF928 domain-containing protein [Phormidesmis sp.]
MKIFRSAFALTLLSCTLLSPVSVSADDALPTFVFSRPQRHSGSGVPDNLDTAIGRGECPQLSALVPTEIPVIEVIPGQWEEMLERTWGLTTVDEPVIWFRVSQPVPGASFNLSIKTRDGTIITAQQKVLSETDTFFSMSLPSGSLAQKETFYSFTGSMEVPCEIVPGSAPQIFPIEISGWIQRIDPPVSVAELETDRDLAITYAAAGLWFDTFDTVVRLHQLDPTDAWVNAALAELMAKLEPVKIPESYSY